MGIAERIVSRLRFLAPLLCSLLAVVLFSRPASAASPPQRIISAAPSITEMLYSLGVGDRVVGVTSFCHYPPEVRSKPKIGTYMNPNLETILDLRPDLVVILKEHVHLGESLRRVGLPVLELQHNDISGIYESLRELGRSVGAEDTAGKRIAEIQSALDSVQARAKGLPRRSVMFIVGRTPSMIRDLLVVGRGSFLNELITIAGGRNLFAETATFYPKISVEELYAGRPDVIIDMGDMADTDRVTEQHKRDAIQLWQQFQVLPAVSAGRVYIVANDIFVVPGPRITETASELFRMIHPEASQ